MAQSVEHIVHIDGVTGSSPVATTTRLAGRNVCQVFSYLAKQVFSGIESCLRTLPLAKFVKKRGIRSSKKGRKNIRYYVKDYENALFSL